MLMQTLNILENFDLKAMGHNSPAYIHTVAEALKLCFGDREAFYADPNTPPSRWTDCCRKNTPPSAPI